jgi:hypothetical protein
MRFFIGGNGYKGTENAICLVGSSSASLFIFIVYEGGMGDGAKKTSVTGSDSVTW